jgi:hypothetical protein
MRAAIPDRTRAHIDALRKLAENGSDKSRERGRESDIDSQVMLVVTETRELFDLVGDGSCFIYEGTSHVLRTNIVILLVRLSSML